MVRRLRDIYSDAHGGRDLNLFRPRRYTEKMQWRKLFDLDPRYAILSDKLAVRDFIASRGGRDHLVPLLWHGDDPDEIPFDDLTPPYVLKSTHAAGDWFFVGPGQELDRAAIRATARQWLSACYGTRMNEPGYINVPRRLVIERQLLSADGLAPYEHKIYVFDGKVALIRHLAMDSKRSRTGAFYTPDWQVLPWIVGKTQQAPPLPRPPLLDAMNDMAARLGAGFDHVRVDVYNRGDRFWLGEITVYTLSGLANFTPDDVDEQIGRFWTLRYPRLRALATILTRSWEIRPPPQSR
jgi:hypothetical protein